MMMAINQGITTRTVMTVTMTRITAAMIRTATHPATDLIDIGIRAGMKSTPSAAITTMFVPPKVWKCQMLIMK
jgi:hypothetical protein